MVQLFSSRTTRWRTTAVLVCLGSAVKIAVTALFAAHLVSAFDSRTVFTMYLLWPSEVGERLLTMVRTIAQLKAGPPQVFGFLALHMLVSMLLAIGLWKLNKWAAWTTTALLLFKITTSILVGVPLIRLGPTVRWSALEWMGTLAWSTAYLLLLWGDWGIDNLRGVASFLSSVHHERVLQVPETASVEPLTSKTRLSIGAKVLVGLIGLLSFPSYARLLLLLLQRAIAEPGMNLRGLAEWAYLLGIASVILFPLALLVALAGTALPIKRRGKVLAWQVNVGGVLSWFIASLIQPNVWW